MESPWQLRPNRLHLDKRDFDKRDFETAFIAFFDEEHQAFRMKMFHNLDQLQLQLEKENLHAINAKTCLEVLRTQFKEFFASKVNFCTSKKLTSSDYVDRLWQEDFKDYTGYDPEPFRSDLLKYVDILDKFIDKRVLKYESSGTELENNSSENALSKPVNETQMQIAQVVPAPIQAPQPRPTARPTRTLPKRVDRLEDVHEMQEALGEQREYQAWKYTILAVCQIVHCASGLSFLTTVCLIRQREKENGVNILKSIDEGPFQMGMFRETLAEGEEGFPKDIYTLINHYTDAKDIWDNVKMLLEGKFSISNESNGLVTQPENGSKWGFRVRMPSNDFKASFFLILGFYYELRDFTSSFLAEFKTPLLYLMNFEMTRKSYGMVAMQGVWCWRVFVYKEVTRRHLEALELKVMMEVLVRSKQGKLSATTAMENGVALDKEQLLFIACGQDNVVDDDVDEQPIQDLALNVDNVFQDDDCDAFDSDVDEAPTAQIMFMENLSYPVYDEAGLSYDSYILSEKENKYLKEFLDMKALKEKVEDKLYKKDQSLQTVHMLYKPKSYYDEQNKKQLTPEQIFWSKDLLKMNEKSLKEQTTASRPIKALTVNPLNTPATLVPRVPRTKSLVKFNIFVLIQLFSDFEKTGKKRITPTGLTEGERGFGQTKECYLTEVIPFFKTLKDLFEGIQKALTKEIKEMKEIFEELEAEVDQNVMHRKQDEIEWKSLLFANDNLIVDYLSKDVFYTAIYSMLTISRFSNIHEALNSAQKHIVELESKNSNLQNKIKMTIMMNCSKDFNKGDKQIASTPVTSKKQVTFIDPCETSTNNILTHVKQQTMHQTNEPAIPSTRVKGATAASGSKPRSNKKKDMTLPAKSDMQKVEVHPRNFMKKFMGIVIFGNDHFGAIMGYGDYVIGDSVISRVYYVEGLGHNLFSVRQFCDSDLEVSFRKHSCYVRDLDGVELIKGSRGSNLYTISIKDMLKSSPICLLSKASKNKSWLWNHRLNHLNFGTINNLTRKDLVRGLPRLKF
nr:retrovirus-related Pol polyprotein from transposon TNT 1-94 [Tanacetum cinerariifolium]